MAKRIQLSRKKGWKVPPNTVKVDRTTMWGNFVGRGYDPALAVKKFARWVEVEASWAWLSRMKIELRGRNLACWCKLDQPCHADVLLEIAKG